MKLIANTGIHFFETKIEVDANENFKMYFHEWFNVTESSLKLEIAHRFNDDEDIWVSKKSLSNLGYAQDGMVKDSWEEIKDDFLKEGFKPIDIETELPVDSGCFQVSLSRFPWESFENTWLPMPFFALRANHKTQFGPTNWCRFRLTPLENKGAKRKYTLLIAFDTRAKYEDEDFEDADLKEFPVFESNYDLKKEFGLCNDEYSLVDFCSKAPYNCEWVDSFLLNLLHGTNDIDSVNIKKPKLKYLANCIYLINYIQKFQTTPKVTLYSDQHVAFGDVDLVVDIGNSQTCAVLFDDHDFSKVEQLEFLDWSSTIDQGKLSVNKGAFDMRMAFRDVDFGINTIRNSRQFVLPSLVRLGAEANDLIYRSLNDNPTTEKVSSHSSPKRFLWDNKHQKKEWEFISVKENEQEGRLVYVKGVTEQLNSDGSLNDNGDGAIEKLYSRKALMTLAFLEILAQAKRQINSTQYRKKWGDVDKPRRISKIIVTCPTAMSQIEQNALRQCAEDAQIMLERFYKGTYSEPLQQTPKIVVPSSKNHRVDTDYKEWIYDESSCSQFVFLYSEVTKRYLNNVKEYFDFYGKLRDDLGEYKNKSLTIGSVDIGAGTTDLMITSYKYDNPNQCSLTPVPLFWESFYIAGDDLLKNLIVNLIIEGEHATISNKLNQKSKNERAKLILDYFGPDNARQSVSDRQFRRDFTIQVAVPVITYFLDVLKSDNVEKATYKFAEIFKENVPNEGLQRHFEGHFGFSLAEITWNYDKNVISRIIQTTFEDLVAKISTLLSFYGCDIVLLAGRPTSLKCLSDLFVKNNAVSPNRLITLNNYRVGTWYPFQNGEGYFTNAKTSVAVGAMICNYSITNGSLNGFSLRLEELARAMKPTTDYFTNSELGEPFISPDINSSEIEVSQLPFRIWTRQLNSRNYPTRPFYSLDFDEDRIKERIKKRTGLTDSNQKSLNDHFLNDIERLKSLSPFTFHVIRESFNEDKESLIIETVLDKNGDEIANSYFSIGVQSLSEKNNYWLDTGEFTNLSITNS